MRPTLVGTGARLAQPWSRLARRLGTDVRELACLAGIVLGGAALRFVNLPGRGGWDSDQGTEMLALRPWLDRPSAHLWAGGDQRHQLLPITAPSTTTFSCPPPGSAMATRCGWWPRLLCSACLSSPRSGGSPEPSAGLRRGLQPLLAATSASLISYATFIWNPTVVEPGAAVAYLGAWQAIRTKRAAWWLVAAVGGAVVAQAHIAAAFILLPLGAAFVVDLSRGPATRRRNVLIYGLVGVAIFVATYLPFIVWELGHNFTETRGILAYFSTPGSPASQGPLVRVVVAAIRILAWPLTRWPQIDLRPAFPVAFVVASATS